MNYFLKKVVVLFILVSSVNLFAQDDSLGEKQKKPFQPKFTLGSGIYTLTGDIQNEESGLLKGKAGFNAGMKFDISDNIDLSFLFLKTSFSGDNGLEEFSSDVDGFGLHLGYTVNQLFKQSRLSPILSLGVQRLGVSTTIDNVKKERSSSIVIPLGFGVRMDITDRLQFDIAMNFGMGMSDIDMSKATPDKADGYKSLNFAIHYDLFTTGKNDNIPFDDSYYADVDFAKLEAEDEDRDLVRDMDDYCPQTPSGVKVDENGCPLDDDKDGIPNYLDQQNNTPEGAIVDENGVKLTDDKYQSMYSDIEVASRKYANFYNEVEIKRENYKTIDEYLIAKANAFNKAFYESQNNDSEVSELIYRVKIGEFKDGIPPKITNKLLSLDDLESITMDDDAVIYVVGSYATVDEAMSRLFALEEKGFEDTYIILDNNGNISDYVEPVPEPEIEEKVLVFSDEKSDTTDMTNDSIVKEVEKPINETTYRIQIGAFNKSLPEEIFANVDNVISFTGKDGLVRYTTGSFTEYKDAIDYQAQMKARGFDDAFIVTYKNGERIGLDIAIKTENTNSAAEKKESTELVVEKKEPNEIFGCTDATACNYNPMAKSSDGSCTYAAINANCSGACLAGFVSVNGVCVTIDFKFTVQIMVASSTIPAADLPKLSKLGNIDKEQSGNLYKYYAGTYSNLEEANIQLEKAKSVGFSQAFVFVTNNGERITLEQAKELLK